MSFGINKKGTKCRGGVAQSVRRLPRMIVWSQRAWVRVPLMPIDVLQNWCQRCVLACLAAVFSAGVNSVGKHSVPRNRTLMVVPCIGETHPMHVKTNTLVAKEKGVHPVYCTCRSQLVQYCNNLQNWRRQCTSKKKRRRRRRMYYSDNIYEFSKL